jgi:F0F1-type ATP synthase membrane subunit c/vacuolar-type H+-ATPase subunit K
MTLLEEKNMDTQPDWRRAFRVAVFVHATIVVTILIYALVLEVLKTVLKPMPRLAPGTNIQVLRYVFYGLAIVAVVLVRQVNHGVLRRRPREPLGEFLHRLSRSAVLSSILCEAPALLGLVLTFLTGVSRDFWYLMFVSLFLAFMYFPRRQIWAEILREKYPREGI